MPREETSRENLELNIQPTAKKANFTRDIRKSVRRRGSDEKDVEKKKKREEVEGRRGGKRLLSEARGERREASQSGKRRSGM